MVETAIAMNSSIPATIATTPKSTPIVVTLVMSKRKMTSEKTSHAIPVRRNSHQRPLVSFATSRGSNMLSTVVI